MSGKLIDRFEEMQYNYMILNIIYTKLIMTDFTVCICPGYVQYKCLYILDIA
jgi:hypothetical protein